MVESRRSDVAQVLELGHNVVRHTINGERPWLVIDTANATLDIENENDNSEVGAYMAALKQTIYTQLGASITIVTHTSKTISREDDAAMARGASAFTGDATLTAVLFMDDEKNRYMRLVKTRYEPINREIKFNTSIYSEVVINRHGNMQDLQCVIVVPESSSEEGRKKIAADAREAKKNAAILDKCDEACSYVQSIINSCPEGVIVKRGKGGSHIPPSEFQGMTELTMNEICQAVPGSDTGPNRKAIADAVAARFAPIKVVGSWLQLS